MRRRVLIGIGLLLVLIVGIILLLQALAPPTTDVTPRDCVRADAENCLRLPSITGANLDGETVRLPDELRTDYALIVMPFDREQQETAVEWLPLFQELSAVYGDIAYYNLAPLVVDAPFRPLVTGGLNLAVREPAVRSAVVIAFVSEADQQQIVQALAAEDAETMQVLLVDGRGQVLWRSAGSYDEAAAEALREALATRLSGHSNP